MTPKAVDKEARKKEIALCALPLFAQRGFEAASISQIAEAVGVKKGTIYDYFASKDELILEALGVWMEQVTGEFEAVLDDLSDPVQQLRAFGQGAVAAMSEPFALQLTLATTQVMFQEGMEQKFHFMRELLLRARRGVGQLLLEGIAQGVFRAEVARDVDKIAVNLLAFLDGLALHYYFLGGKAFAIEDQVDFYIERLLDEITCDDGQGVVESQGKEGSDDCED